MPVSLMVAEEKVLAVGRFNSFPVLNGFLHCRHSRVFVIIKWNI
jgi:hypothetical protein